MKDSSRQRAIRFESDLLDAMSGEDVRGVLSSLEALEKTWSTVQLDVLSKEKANKLDPQLSYGDAARVGALSESFIDLETETAAFFSGLNHELDTVLAPVDSSSRLSHPPHSTAAPEPHPHHRGASLDATSCIAPAYRWLLKNLHDPYPSNEIKTSISQSTGTSLKQINAWFINTRRRIGWTTLARTHFSNNRSETVDAAFRALVKDDPKRPLESNIILEFMALKVTAESLYSERFRKSVLAGRLDVAVKDLADGEPLKSRSMPDSANETIVQISKSSTKSSYPSPDRSIHGSPESSIPSSLTEEGEELSPPGLIAGRKRRISPSLDLSDSEGISLDCPQDRPKKRFRASETPSKTSIERSIVLPLSPQSPCTDNLPQFDFPSEATSVQSRKRRLSDADSLPMPKRPRGLDVDPRPHAVSDPLPLPSAVSETSKFDNWFQFDIPDAVTSEDLDPSTPIEVEMFKDWFLLNGDVAESSVQPDRPIPSQQVELLCSELQSITTEGFDLASIPGLIDDISGDTDTSLDEFGPSTPISLLPIGDDGLFTQSDLDKLVSTDSSGVATLGPFVHSENFFDLINVAGSSSHSSSCGRQSDGPSPPLPPSLDSTDDAWTQFSLSLPSNPSSNPADSSSRAFFDDIMSQGLPDIDPSVFLSLVPTPAAILDHNHEQTRLLAEKQAKLKKLRKYQEEVRRLEAELAI